MNWPKILVGATLTIVTAMVVGICVLAVGALLESVTTVNVGCTILGVASCVMLLGGLVAVFALGIAEWRDL